MKHPVLTMLAFLAAAVLLGCQSSPEPQQEQPEGPDHQAMHPAGEQQQPDQQELAERHEQVAEQFSDEDLERFADGVEASNEHEEQLAEEGRDLETIEEEAETPQELQRAEEEYVDELAEVLADVGLRFEDFMEMGALIRENPILRDRLRDHLDEDTIEDFFGEAE